MDRIAVVGGGLAGLVAAGRLATAGREVTLFERAEAVGGRVRTRRRDGFTLDRGFQVVFDAYPAVRRELDLEALALRRSPSGAVGARPGRRFTFADPRRHPEAAIATLTHPDAGLGDLLRLYRLARSLRRRDPGSLLPGPDQTVREELARRGFSDRFVDAFLAPFYGGITLDRSLSTAAGVFRYTFKMLAEGHAAVPAAGMGAIPAQLADRARSAGVAIETGAEVTGLEVTGDGVSIELADGPQEADAAVVATDPPTARELTGVDAVPVTGRGCVTQYCALPAGEAPLTDGRLLLNAEGRTPNHVVPLSAVAPAYAPADSQLVAAVFLGSLEASDAAYAAATRRALEAWYPDRSFAALEPLATDRTPFAQFDQPPGSLGALPAPTAPSGPVFLAGDYTRWSSIQGALESGRRAAAAVLESD